LSRWSAKGFGEAIELTGRWVKLLDTLCQLAYMIYITNSNARINILSITASCREYTRFVAQNSWKSVTRLARPLGWGGVEFGQLIFRKII